MERIAIGERQNWREDAAFCGFDQHTVDGQRYWDERNAYRLTMPQVENDLEAPTDALMGMCYAAMDRVVNDSSLMTKIAIPELYHEAVYQSWHKREYDLYGRFDLAYDGKGPAKLLEFNADTPTTLFEAAVFQWRWLEDMKGRGLLPEDADQFNSIHERLIDALKVMTTGIDEMHFTAPSWLQDDWGTIQYLADCALQAGVNARLIDIEHLGVDAENYFTDMRDMRIAMMFKLYPLEDLMREEYGPILTKTPTRIVEPLWKSVLSNKGILPILWEMFEGHENLLPAYFETDPKVALLGNSYVRKPIYSREGLNVTIVDPSLDGGKLDVEGHYGEEGHIRQAVQMLPKFGDDYAVIGSWVVAGAAAGMGIREDVTPVTRNNSRFVPHFIHG